MKRLLSIFSFFLFFNLSAQVETVSQKPLSIGEIKTIKSSVLNENRQLNIYLPNHYDSRNAYPVIFLLDGSIDEDFVHVAGLVQFFNLIFTMPETIVIGIENVDRRRDFTFKTDSKDLQQDYPTAGHSDKFISFLESELLPYVESHYKTTAQKYLIGQSLGGLLACEILVKKPQLFTHYLIVSPSLWWDDESLLKQANSAISKSDFHDKYVCVSVGEKEEKVMLKDAFNFYKTISKSAKGVKSDYVLMTGEDHATISHQSLYKTFVKLFKPRY